MSRIPTIVPWVLCACLPWTQADGETLIVGPGEAYASIQPAIDAARDGDTVLVRPGEYAIVDPIDFNRLHVPGEPASPAVKDITVRSEGGPETTTIRMADEPEDPVRASVVVFENGETSASVLEGFTLRGGSGTETGKPPRAAGGGIFMAGASSPTILDCAITDNASDVGGGVFCGTDCAPTLKGCTISGNWASRDGGGACCADGSSAAFEDCTISGNGANHGGGIDASGDASVTVTACQLSGNSAKQGGGISCNATGPTSVVGCRILDNDGRSKGGGIYCGQGSTPSVVNCDIAGNRAKKGAGVYCAKESSPSLVNCTIGGNRPKKTGGVGCHKRSKAKLTNCIVSDPSEVQKRATADHCLLDTDPLFEAAGSFDFKRYASIMVAGRKRKMPNFIVQAPDHRLTAESPAIDAGIATGAPTMDIEGYGRPCGSGFDIGAYEFGGCIISRDPFWRGDLDGNGSLNITDPIYLLNYLFLGGPPPTCFDAADVDDTGTLDRSDAVYSLNHQFLGGPTPLSPYPDCDLDPTLDPLDCELPPICP